MTVSATVPLEIYNGNGVIKRFTWDWDMLDDSVIDVLLNREHVNNWTLQGQEVVFDTPPAIGDEVIVFRVTKLWMPEDYRNFGRFVGAKTEQSLDRLYMVAQELEAANLINGGSARINNLFAERAQYILNIVSERGTDAVLEMYDPDTDLAGIFAGEVTQDAPPNATVTSQQKGYQWMEWGNVVPPPVPLCAYADYSYQIRLRSGQVGSTGEEAFGLLEISPVNISGGNIGFGEMIFRRINDKEATSEVSYQPTAPEGFGPNQYLMRLEERAGSDSSRPPTLRSVNDLGQESFMETDTWVDLYAPAGRSVDGAGRWEIYHGGLSIFSNNSLDAGWDIRIAQDDGAGNPVDPCACLVRWKTAAYMGLVSGSPSTTITQPPVIPIYICPDSQLVWVEESFVNWRRTDSGFPTTVNMYFYERHQIASESVYPSLYDAADCGYYFGENLDFRRYTSFADIYGPFDRDDAIIIKVDKVSGANLDVIQWGSGQNVTEGIWFPAFRCNLELNNLFATPGTLNEGVYDLTLAINTAPDGTAANYVPIAGTERRARVRFIAENNTSGAALPDLTPPDYNTPPPV